MLNHPERLTVEEVDERYRLLLELKRGCAPCLAGPLWPVILLFAGCVVALLGVAKRR